MKKLVLFLIIFEITSFFIFSKGNKNDDFIKLQNGQANLHQKIDSVGEKQKLFSEQKIAPIYDGVADINEFLKRNYRVMFILKEGYDDWDEDGNPKGGGWMMTEGFDDGHYEIGSRNQTWKRILQVSYGIFNREQNFSKIPKVPSTFYTYDEFGKIIRSIIYINTSKMPAQTLSSNYDVQQKFYVWKEIIREQINLYEPDIIIFGGTYTFYKNSFRELFGTKAPSDNEMKVYGDGRCVKGAFKDEKNRLFIIACHPSNRVKSATYFGDIIHAVEDWKKDRLKTSA